MLKTTHCQSGGVCSVEWAVTLYWRPNAKNLKQRAIRKIIKTAAFSLPLERS